MEVGLVLQEKPIPVPLTKLKTAGNHRSRQMLGKNLWEGFEKMNVVRKKPFFSKSLYFACSYVYT